MNIIDTKDIVLPQQRMSLGLLIATIVVMMTVQYMTLDMYLPALPVLKDLFHTTEAALNVSLNTDLFLFGVGSLVGGTISDKYGRRPIMLAGLMLSTIAIFLGALSPGVVFLSVMRGLSGLGGGFALSVASAIIRDSFKGRTFQTITTITQASAVVGPIFAPACGAFLVEHLSWRWIFLVLGGLSLLTLIPFFIFSETWPKERRQISSVWQATLQSFELAKNGEYMLFMAMVILMTFPLWSYLAICSYVYFDDFGISNLQYSILYALGSVSSVLAPFLYIWLARRRGDRSVINLSFLLLIASCVLFVTLAGKNAILFLIAAIPLLMVEAIVRSQSMVIVLEENSEQAGSASSLTSFLVSIITVFGTTAATLPWDSFLHGLTVITIISTLISIILWILVLKKGVYRRQLRSRR